MFRVSFFAALLMACFMSIEVAAGKQPNIVFVLADDMGWADTGFNGNEFYETPNMDRLCKEGVNFTRAYSGGPNCMPTRACLVSGMYTPRTKMWTPGGKSQGEIKYMKLLVPSRGHKSSPFPTKLALKPSVVSIAEVLKSAGYTTARLGKWHCGRDTQGFDISDPSGRGGHLGRNYYGNVHVHEWLTDAGCKFMENNKDKPFFLYVSHWDVHTPIRCRPDVKARYNKKLSEKQWDYKWNTAYAGMMTAVDVSVGRLYEKIKELGLEKNTLFIFSSDNGGHRGITTNRPLKGGKGSLYEGGVRVPTFMVWSGVIKGGSNCPEPITSVDFLPTFAELAKADLPKKQQVDGSSIVPLLRGDRIKERAIFWHYPLYLNAYAVDDRVHNVLGTDKPYWRAVPSSMVVKGDWKLIELFEDNSTLLFNVTDDIGESKDLSKEKPEIARRLLDELKAWQKETGAVVPSKINPAFDNKM